MKYSIIINLNQNRNYPIIFLIIPIYINQMVIRITIYIFIKQKKKMKPRDYIIITFFKISNQNKRQLKNYSIKNTIHQKKNTMLIITFKKTLTNKTTMP